MEKFWKNKGIDAMRVDFNLLAIHQDTRMAHEKAFALTLYTMGLFLSAIDRLFHISTIAVLRWRQNFAERISEKPEPSEVVIVELDEMRHFLTSKK